MTRHANLIRDGVEATAAHVYARVRSYGKGRKSLCVRNAGQVRVFPTWRLPESELPHLVGTYVRKTPVELIAEDCAQWLEENTPGRPA